MKRLFFHQHLVPLTSLVFLAALFTLPMLLYGFWPFSADPPLHESWYYHFSQQFWQGELYPRWLTGMNEGLGSPVFFYYPPLPFWITSLLHPFVPNDPAGWRQLGISTFLSLAISGLGCYFWLRPLTNRRAAAITGVLYMLMPYHLAMDLYNRGAFAEFWAFSWMPFILFFVDQAFRGSRLAAPSLALSYAALIMTHLPTTLIFSPLALGYIALSWKLTSQGKPAFSSLLGMILGTGLAAIYLIPAMTMQEHASMKALYQFHYANSFFFGRSFLFGDEFKMSLLSCALATISAGVAAAFLLKKDASHEARIRRTFWIGMCLGIFFMMLPVSDFLWRLVPILQIIQFPWRFNSVLCVAALPLIAMGLAALQRPLTARHFVLLQISYASIVVWLYLTTLYVWRQHLIPTQDASVAVPTSHDPPEYRPAHVKVPRQAVVEQHAIPNWKTNMVVRAPGVAQTISHKPRHLVLGVAAQTNGVLLVRQFYYYGWTAALDGMLVKAQPSAPEGLIQVPVPAGQHRLSLTLVPQKEEKAGKCISAISLLILLLIVGASLRPRRRSSHLNT